MHDWQIDRDRERERETKDKTNHVKWWCWITCVDTMASLQYYGRAFINTHKHKSLSLSLSLFVCPSYILEIYNLFAYDTKQKRKKQKQDLSTYYYSSSVGSVGWLLYFISICMSVIIPLLLLLLFLFLFYCTVVWYKR